MTIVEVIPSLSKRAGAEVFLLNLINEFKSTENVVVISLYNDIDRDIEKELIDLGIKIYYCNKRIGIDFKCSRKFKEIIKKIKPDVLHMHLNCITTYFLAFGFKRQKFHVYLTVHSLVEKDFKKIEQILICKYVKKDIVIMIGISALISKNIEVQLGIKDVITIYNGTRLLEPIYKEPNSTTFNIVCVAAFRPEKNQQLLISAFLEAQTKCSRHMQLSFVGDGPLLAETKANVDALGCTNIRFCGQQNDVYQFLKNSHIFCLSSKYEGNPISIIEAMSVGLPIIAPRVGGIPDIITDGTNGDLFIPEDKNDLTDKIIDLVTNDKKRDSIRKNNIDRSKKYSIQICAKNYLKLFNEIKNNG